MRKPKQKKEPVAVTMQKAYEITKKHVALLLTADNAKLKIVGPVCE